MPRDEPVGSLGRLALKPTEFSEQLSLIRFRLLHDVPPCLDDSGATLSLRSTGRTGGRESAEQRCRGKRLSQPLLPIARLNV